MLLYLRSLIARLLFVLTKRFAGIAIALACTVFTLFTATADDEGVPILPPWYVMAPDDPLGLPQPLLAHSIPLDADGPGLRAQFRRIPGLLVQESFGGVDPPRLSARGSGIQSAPLSRGLFINFNGLPLNLADGSFNLALIENAWLDHAQFVAGPAAGVPALGGALSLWSQGGRFEPSRKLRLGGGSDKTVFVQPQWVEAVDQGVLAIEGGFLHSDGWRDQSSQRRESLWAGWHRRINEHTRIRYQLYAVRPSFEVPGPLPKSMALEDPKRTIPRVQADRPQRSSDYLRGGITLQQQAAEGTLALSVFGVYHADDFRQLLPNGMTQSNSREAGLTLDLVRENALIWEGETHFRLYLQAARGNSQRFTTVGGQPGDIIGDNDLRPATLNARLAQQWTLNERHQFEMGMGLLAARRAIRENFSGRPTTALSDSDAKLMPFLGWTYSFSDSWSLAVTYARGYEPPTFSDLLFTEFNPPPPQPVLRSRSLAWQRADSLDLRLQGGSDSLVVATGPHYAVWRNEWLRLVDDTGAALGTVNADKTIHAGWETALSWLAYSDPQQQWTLWLNHQYLNVRFDNDSLYGNRRLAGIPPHSGAIGLRGDFIGGWFFANEVFGQAGKAWADHANTLSSGGFGIWNLDTGRAHPSGWLVGLRILNVLDRRAIASTAGVLDEATMGANQPIFLPASGRRFELRMEYQW